jgi:integral membrane protein (TIGR01906 family)
MESLRGALAALIIGVATAIVIVALAIIPFLNPIWVGFGQDRAQAQAWTGYTTEQLRLVTNDILADLVIGPAAFDVSLNGAPVLEARERQHMVDVAVVFQRFFLVAAGSALLIAGSFAFSRTDRARTVLWRRLSISGLVIAVVTVVGGIGGVLLFDQAFALFHELFFPPGSWTFDAGSEKLVQLFPQQFWVETTIAVGVVIVGLSLLLWWYGGRRARAHAAYETTPADGTPAEVPAG